MNIQADDSFHQKGLERKLGYGGLAGFGPLSGKEKQKKKVQKNGGSRKWIASRNGPLKTGPDI